MTQKYADGDGVSEDFPVALDFEENVFVPISQVATD